MWVVTVMLVIFSSRWRKIVGEPWIAGSSVAANVRGRYLECRYRRCAVAGSTVAPSRTYGTNSSSSSHCDGSSIWRGAAARSEKAAGKDHTVGIRGNEGAVAGDMAKRR